MKNFVNYKKRGIQLPKGCKDLADVLNVKPSQPESAAPGFLSGVKCEYCGRPAVGASSIYSGGKLTEHGWCEQCHEDWTEFHSQPENSLPTDFNLEDEATRLRFEDLCRREAEFIRQRVAERKGK